MPPITRAQTTASKSRFAPYPAHRSPPAQRSPRPAHSFPPVVREPTPDQQPRARPKFKWTWTADRKLLVNLLGARLPLSEAACTQLADLFNGPNAEDVRARVEFLSGQRELTLREDSEAAESTAPIEDAVESQQLAAEEVDHIDLDRSDTSSQSSVEVAGGCLPTLQLLVASSPAQSSRSSPSPSPSPSSSPSSSSSSSSTSSSSSEASSSSGSESESESESDSDESDESDESSFASSSSPSPSPSQSPAPTPSTPSPSPRPDLQQPGSPVSHTYSNKSPSPRSSTPTSTGSSTSSNQSSACSQPTLPAVVHPLKSAFKTCSKSTRPSVRFDDSRNERREYEADGLFLRSARNRAQRDWVPVDNADWEQPLLKRKRENSDNDSDSDSDSDEDEYGDERPAKRICTAGSRFLAGPTAHPRRFSNSMATYPQPVRAIAAVAASQEWQGSDTEIPRHVGRRSVMDYPLWGGRRVTFASPTQFADYVPNTPRAGLYESIDSEVGPIPSVEEEEEIARRSPGANKYRPSAAELAAVGHSGRRDESPDPAPRTMSPGGVEDLSASDDESDSSSSSSSSESTVDYDLVDRHGDLRTPPPPTQEDHDEFRRAALEWMENKRLEQAAARHEAERGAVQDEDDADWNYFHQFDD